MTKLQERLFQYIEEELDEALPEDDAYRLVRRQRNEAEELLTAGLTEEQKCQFSHYMDQENYLISIQLRHMFREPLALVYNILNASL